MGVILANQTFGLPLHWVEAILVITLGTTLFAGCWGKRHSQEKITLFFTIVFLFLDPKKRKAVAIAACLYPRSEIDLSCGKIMSLAKHISTFSAFSA